MLHTERDNKENHLIDENKFDKQTVEDMSDKEIEYFHWLYFEESVYDFM